MDFVSIRIIITGDVARLAGCCEKATGVHEGKKEGRKETMNITDTIAGRDLEARRAAIAGQVFVPGEVGYDQARQAWNLAVDERPGVVVAAESAPTWPKRSGTPAPTAGLRPAVGARPAPGQDRGACPFAVGGRFGDDRLAGPTWWSRRRALP